MIIKNFMSEGDNAIGLLLSSLTFYPQNLKEAGQEYHCS